MMRIGRPLAAGVALLALLAPLRAGGRENRTAESAAEVLRALGDIPARGIPRGLLHDASGVAVIPHAVKAGLLVDGRFGRGLVLVRRPDGTWSNPAFLTLEGGGVGLQVGVESTDLVLVFRTAGGLDRFLKGKGKLTLGGDVSVAAGLIGREAEAATDARLRAEILSYSRSRGLFAGASLEGARLVVDHRANDAFYGLRGCKVADVVNCTRGLAAVANLKHQLDRLDPRPAERRPAVLVVPPGPPRR
jgi:lipid-binding SYLF domain-containing protein